MTCKAYNYTCLKSSQVSHYTKVYKKNGEKKTKEEEVTTNTVQSSVQSVGQQD
jgi:hypothetical protein